jgi:hypothetical protein
MRFGFAIISCVLMMSWAGVAQDNAGTLRFQNNYATNGALAISGVNNDGERKIIKLAGIDYLSDNQKLVQIALDDMINDNRVFCKMIVGNMAQCLNAREQDMALSLIERGLVKLNRATVENTSFKQIYNDAQSNARRNAVGLWPFVTSFGANSTMNSISPSGNGDLFSGANLYILVIALVTGPLLGMVIVAIIMYGGFGRLIKLQKYQIAQAQQRDRAMREREKFIVAAALEGEINTNRAKLDAFMIIYEDMLKNLRDPSKEPKYKKSGDIIHEVPALSRNVFDSNADKLDLLGPTLVTDLNVHYMDVNANPNYKTFEPDAAIEDVIAFVLNIVKHAESMLSLMDSISGALNIIVRDSKTKSAGRI